MSNVIAIGNLSALSSYLPEGVRAAVNTLRHWLPRATLVADLQGIGFDVLPSAANFIFARYPGRDGADLAAKLRERSIIVRHFRNPPRVSPYLRITVGTAEEVRLVIDALTEFSRRG